MNDLESVVVEKACLMCDWLMEEIK